MKACIECLRDIRPRGTTVEQHPGTVSGAARGLCQSCYQSGDDHHAPKIVHCARCWYEEEHTGGRARKYKLCRDCRSVLPRDQWEAWAA